MSIMFKYAIVGSLLLAPAAAHAAVVTGSFAGTIDSGLDTSGIFGAPATTLDGFSINGTFSYNQGLFSEVLGIGTNAATAISTGALTVTVTIASVSYTFTDQTSASIDLDTSTSSMSLQNANSQSGVGFSVAETFFLSALDPINPFLQSASLAQSFSAMPFLSSGTFSINNTGPNGDASGAFSLTSLSLEAPTETPEPASLALLLTGLAGIMARRYRATRRG